MFLEISGTFLLNFRNDSIKESISLTKYYETVNNGKVAFVVVDL